MSGTISTRWTIACHLFAIVSLSFWLSSAFSDSSLTDNSIGWSTSRIFRLKSCYTWSFLICQFPAGILAYMNRPKNVISISLAVSSFLTFLVPGCSYSMTAMFINRILLGMSQSLILPCCFRLFEVWSINSDRTRFVIFCYSGVYAGSCLSSVSCLVLDWSDVSWTWCMYLPAILGTLMSLNWFVFGRNSPVLRDEYTTSIETVDELNFTTQSTDAPLLPEKCLEDDLDPVSPLPYIKPKKSSLSSISSTSSTSSYAGSFASRRFNIPGDGEFDNINLDVVYDLNPPQYVTPVTLSTVTKALQQETQSIDSPSPVETNNNGLFLLLFIKPSILAFYLMHWCNNFIAYSFQIPPSMSSSSSSLELNAAISILFLLLVNAFAYLFDSILASRRIPLHVLRKLTSSIGLAVFSILLLVIAGIVMVNIDSVDDDDVHFSNYISRILDVLTVLSIVFYSFILVGLLPNLLELCRYSTSPIAFGISNTFATIPSIFAPMLFHEATSGTIHKQTVGFMYFCIAIFIQSILACVIWLVFQSSFPLFPNFIGVTRNRTRTSTSC